MRAEPPRQFFQRIQPTRKLVVTQLQTLPKDPTVELRLGPYGGARCSRGGAHYFERGTPPHVAESIDPETRVLDRGLRVRGNCTKEVN